MSRYKVVDNIRIKLTAEEEVARDKVIRTWCKDKMGAIPIQM